MSTFLSSLVPRLDVSQRQLQTIGIASIFSILTSAQAIFIILSKRDTTSYSFSTTMLNCLTEFLKLLISLTFLSYHWSNDNGWNKEEYQLDRGITLLHYLAPAVMYAFKNILQFSAALYMDAPTYQVLKNLNIIATGILYYFTFGRQLDRRQIESMVLLLVGVSLIQVKPEQQFFQDKSSMWGLFLCLVMAILSAAAGIYTEVLIKKAREKSLHVQNIQLYFFGMICNVLLYWLWEDTHHLPNFYEGLLSTKSICVITTTVLSGLSVSMLLKYADNIVKVYSSGLSVVFTAIYCMLYLGFDPSLIFWFGTIVIVISIDIYYMKFGPFTQPPKETAPKDSNKNEQQLSIIISGDSERK